ncbi:hypothetical protein [Lederbergia citri]|uniref:Uncharacterized protein n=1 Tax=Lederbergia citri TaxID=2833580 RepID=A0A942TEU6_9BACI|nr:hypothetical protein [Lederbergia citri]MBS4196605.1 hypothetical protein [Lederbergia citri]
MKDIKENSIKILVVLLIISLFYNLKLLKDIREFKKEVNFQYETKLHNINTELYAVLKTMNTSISNNKIYIGENGIVKDYYERDLRQVARTFQDLSNLHNSPNSKAEFKKINILPLGNILNSYSEFLDLLYKKNQNASEQYIDLVPNDLEGISIIKETMSDLINIINSDEGKKDSLINILQEFTNYSKSKEFEEKRLKIEELNKALTQG